MRTIFIAAIAVLTVNIIISITIIIIIVAILILYDKSILVEGIRRSFLTIETEFQGQRTV